MAALVGMIGRCDSSAGRHNRHVIGHAMVGIIGGNLLLGYTGLIYI